jgi:hypothetical protein
MATLTINITIAGGKTTPSGRRSTYGWSEGDLEVTSDTDDEIHAHIGGPGYELPVQAGMPATGSFTLDNAGRFEVECHHLRMCLMTGYSLADVPPIARRRGRP